eukprot:g54952.t1
MHDFKLHRVSEATLLALKPPVLIMQAVEVRDDKYASYGQPNRYMSFFELKLSSVKDTDVANLVLPSGAPSVAPIIRRETDTGGWRTSNKESSRIERRKLAFVLFLVFFLVAAVTATALKAKRQRLSADRDWASIQDKKPNNRFTDLGSICITTMGHPCEFPFTYQGVTYNSCTSVENNGVPWCNDAAGIWGDCNMQVCEGEAVGSKGVAPSECKTTAGRRCLFPLVYYGVTYHTCTAADNDGVEWCNDEAGTWGDCDLASCQPVMSENTGGTSSNRDGNSPVSSKTEEADDKTGEDGKNNEKNEEGKKSESGSTNNEHGSSNNNNNKDSNENNGGASSSSSQIDGNSGSSNSNSAGSSSSGRDGNSNSVTNSECQTTIGHKCVFPLVYNGVTYNGCTTVDNDGKEWCNDEAGNWGYCDMATCQSSNDGVPSSTDDIGSDASSSSGSSSSSNSGASNSGGLSNGNGYSDVPSSGGSSSSGSSSSNNKNSGSSSSSSSSSNNNNEKTKSSSSSSGSSQASSSGKGEKDNNLRREAWSSPFQRLSA